MTGTIAPKSVQFGGEVFFSEQGEFSSLEQSWWNQEELETQFEADVKKAKRWSLHASNIEKRGMESRLAKDAYESQTMNAKYVYSVVSRHKKLQAAAKNIGSSADTVACGVQRYASQYTQENTEKARKIAIHDQQEANKIYGPMREVKYNKVQVVPMTTKRTRGRATRTRNPSITTRHSPNRCISC